VLQKRSLNILKIIMGNKNITIEGLQSKTNLSRRQIEYSIGRLNNWLKEKEYYEIIKKPSGRYLFKNNINSVLNDLSKGNIEYVLSETERRKMIYLYLYLNYETISLYHFIDLLEVSRGTVNKDLNKLEETLITDNLTINYSRETGYRIDGKERDIQHLMMLIVVETISFDEGNYLFKAVLKEEHYESLREVKIHLVDSVQNNKLNISGNNLDVISYIYVFNIIRGKTIDIQSRHKLASTLEHVLEYQVAKETLDIHKIKSQSQLKFLTTLLLSYSTGDEKIRTDEYFIIRKIIKNILIKLNQSYAINLNNNNVFGQLYSHIRPAMFRMVFNYPMINPIKEDIIKQYKSIYTIMKEIFESLILNTERNISEDELAYLTIHFATFLSTDTNNIKNFINGVIVCPNGVGISVLLYQELAELFPEINFIDTISVNEINDVIDDVDVVFSTTLIETKKLLFLVDPVMNNIEKANLVNNFNSQMGYLENDERKNTTNINTFINRMKNYVDIKDEKGLLHEVSHFLSENINVNVKRRQPMLSELIDEQLIQLNISATDWKDVIKKSADPLLKTNKITENYVNAMVKNTEESGPYIVIAENVALPHARPEEGALEVALGVMTLDKPIEFGSKKNDPVKYVFCLSAIDNKTHLKALSELVDLLSDEQFYEIMDNAKTEKRIIDYIKKQEEF